MRWVAIPLILFSTPTLARMAFNVSNSDISFVGNWTDETITSNCSTKSTSQAGSYFQYSFNGTGIDLYFSQLQLPYNLTVSLDGQNSTTLVPAKSDGTADCGFLAYSHENLTFAQHTLTVSNTATPPSAIGEISFNFLAYFTSEPTTTTSSSPLTSTATTTSSSTGMSSGHATGPNYQAILAGAIGFPALAIMLYLVVTGYVPRSAAQRERLETEQEPRSEDETDLESLPTTFSPRRIPRKHRRSTSRTLKFDKLNNIPETPDLEDRETSKTPRNEFPFPRQPDPAPQSP